MALWGAIMGQRHLFPADYSVFALLSVLLVLPGAPALAEYDAWHKQIGSSASVQSRANYGKGIRIAILDTGTNVNHGDLKGRVSSSYSFSTAGGNWRSDRDGHGTSVASAALGSRNGSGMVGVAPGATLLTGQISVDGTASTSAINRALRRATDKGAKVINLSFGDNGWSKATLYDSGLHSAMKYAARKAVIVVSAGNDGVYKPDDTAMHLLLSGVAGRGIMAGSVDSRNRDSSFSNAPGSVNWAGVYARTYFLNAPGESIRLATRTGGTSRQSGTSFAAPVIAGAAALVRARHPHLTPQQTVSILLKSAQDLGAKGTDTLYGRGLLRVDRALSAIGTQRIVSGARVGGPSTALFKSGLAGGTALGGLGDVRNAFAEAVIFDDYGRDFMAEFDGRIVARGPSVSLLDRLLDEPAERMIAAEAGDFTLLVAADVPEEHRTAALLSEQVESPNRAPTGFALAWTAGATEVMIGHGSRFAGGSHADALGAFLSAQGGPSGPVFALAQGGAFGSLSRDISPAFNLAARFSETTPESPRLGLTGNARALAVEATVQPAEGLRFALSPAFLTENSAALGSLSSGAMSLSDGARTMAVTASASWSLDNGLTLRGHYTEGVTTPEAAANSLFRSVDPMRSRAYGASAVKTGLLDDRDSIGFSISRPLRVYSGRADLDVPVGRSLDGAVAYRRADVSLAPDGTQTDFELTYARSLGEGVSSHLHVLLQDDAGHRRGVLEGGVLGRVRVQF